MGSGCVTLIVLDDGSSSSGRAEPEVSEVSRRQGDREEQEGSDAMSFWGKSWPGSSTKESRA